MKGLLVFGCGKMGGAILKGALKSGLDPQNVRVVEPDPQIRKELQALNVKAAASAKDFAGFAPEIVFAAVKPFLIAAVIDDIKPFTDKGAVLLSIVAGRALAWFEDRLGQNAAVVRAMPNTPAAVGRGVTGIFPNKAVSEAQKSAVKELLSACGEVIELETESLMDAVTAVSGSGPAYVFYLTEALTQAALAAGLSEEAAKRMARATVCGAAELMRQSADSPETLRKNVTTPNGTTAAALEILSDETTGFIPLMTKAVDAAKRRSEELGKV